MRVVSSSFLTQLLTEVPDEKQNDWLCVALNFGITFPLLSIVFCLMTPYGATQACGILWSESIVVGSWKPDWTSLLINLSRILGESIVDLWLPLLIDSSRSVICWCVLRRLRG